LSQAKKIDFLYFDAGGGHRSAALALKSVVDSRCPEWRVELVNLQELLDSLDVFRKATGLRLEDVYNLFLAKGWTLGSEYLLRGMHAIIRLYHRQQVALLTRVWQERQPDLVVSLIPNFNRAVFQSLKRACPGVAMVTVLTDFADFPPHFWIERQPQYFICGTAKAVEQACAMGHPNDRVFRVSGMILRPAFYEVQPVDRAAEREKIGLAPDTPAGLLLFGAQGSPAMRQIVNRIGNSDFNVQLIAICGRNAGLEKQLRNTRTRNNVHVTGFTQQISHYMQLSDFLIGKPGPGSISEAMQMKLPVIVEKNARTLPQERYNADWVQEEKVGIVLKSFREIDSAIQQLLAPGALSAMRGRTEQFENRAVFEIADILKELLERRIN
jgi:1,2-diacylglycerol 3-beta-galactosyltransferase